MDGVRIFGHSLSGNLIDEFSEHVSGYKHEWREGPYYADWQFAPDSVSDEWMRDFFAARMMTKIKTTYEGTDVWGGLIGYMKLVYNGVMYLKDFRKVVNAVKTAYREEDADIGVYGYTDWFTNTESLALYGNMEKVMTYSGKVEAVLGDDGAPLRHEDTNAPITEPEQMAMQEVARNAFPFVRQVAPAEAENSLQVMAFGRQMFAQHILLSDGYMANYGEGDESGLRSLADDNTVIHSEIDSTTPLPTTTVSAEIKRLVDIIDYQSTLYQPSRRMYALDISTANTSVTAIGVSRVMSVWDRLKELALLPDQDGNYYRLQIEPDGGVIYGEYDYKPQYYLYPPLKARDGTTPTWNARPGFIRVVDQPAQLVEPGGWLEDTNLIFASRVTMRDGTDAPIFGDDERTEADREAMITANKKRLEKLQR